jgi:porin
MTIRPGNLLPGAEFFAALGLGLGLLPGAAGEISTNESPKTLWERDTLSGDWGGLRPRLSDHGFNFGVEYTGEFLANTRGGVERAGLYQHLLKTTLDLDLEKSAGWQGAQFHASSLWLWGTQPNSRNDIAGLTGSAYSDPSNISGYDTYRLYELWLEQHFLDGKFSVRVGQISLDDEFICSDYACVFLNGTHGWPAFMSATIPNGGEAYPLAGPGVRLDFKPADQWEFLAAVADGDVRDQDSDNKYGTDFRVNARDGALVMVEAAYRINQETNAAGLPGTYKLGGWYHTARFNDLQLDTQGLSLQDPLSSGTPAAHVGDGGVYANFD